MVVVHRRHKTKWWAKKKVYKKDRMNQAYGVILKIKKDQCKKDVDFEIGR